MHLETREVFRYTAGEIFDGRGVKPRLPAGGGDCTLRRDDAEARATQFVFLGVARLVAGRAGGGSESARGGDGARGGRAGGWIVAEGRANAALQAGFPGTALALFEEILRDPALPTEARPRLALARVTAWLDRGDLAEAEQALRDYDGPRTAAYHLRVGLLALQARRLPAAKAALAASKPEELVATDRGWWHFCRPASPTPRTTSSDAIVLMKRPAAWRCRSRSARVLRWSRSRRGCAAGA